MRLLKPLTTNAAATCAACLLFAIVVALPTTLSGQTQAASPAPDGVMLQFMRFADIFGSRLVAAFDSIPAARYDYRPTAPQQTIGYIAQHLEAANYSLCEQLGSLDHPSTAKDSLADTVKARWPKDTLVARLRASLRFCDTALERAGPLDSPARANVLLAFETDLAEHYSQLASYMRLTGMVPPSALPPRRRTTVELPASALPAYVGAYQLTDGPELDVTLRDGKLFAQSKPGGREVRLWAEGGENFFINEVDAQLTFMRDGRGAVTDIIIHQYGRDRAARRIR